MSDRRIWITAIISRRAETSNGPIGDGTWLSGAMGESFRNFGLRSSQNDMRPAFSVEISRSVTRVLGEDEVDSDFPRDRSSWGTGPTCQIYFSCRISLFILRFKHLTEFWEENLLPVSHFCTVNTATNVGSSPHIPTPAQLRRLRSLLIKGH